MKIKLCGFKEEKSLQVAISQNCDFIGFIFYENSPRFIKLDEAVKISKIIPRNIAKVAVVVDAKLEFLSEISQKFSPEFFQFHGAESPEFLLEVRKKFPQIKIIKAFKIAEKSDLEKVKNFDEVADLFLFDGKNAGGGKKFDWEILKDFSTTKEWFLSGGLNIDNIEDALKNTKAKIIDISSGIEEIRGQKSPKLITEFIKKVRNYAA
jgi:phosphoribosylanthranilate isomerase